MIDRDRGVGEEMVHELGIDPAAEIDSDQRAELLREWHRREAERAEEAKRKPKPKLSS